MKPSHLQSLSHRIGSAIRMVHELIETYAGELTGDDFLDKPVYQELSKLQRERKKLEELQRAVKKQLKGALREENALLALARIGFNTDGLTIIHDGTQNVVDL